MASTATFWNWFKERNTLYLNIDDLEDGAKENLLNELLNQLQLYCDHLYFELGGMPGDVQELIITAEGNVDYFKEVELLVADAPSIDSWIFIAFMPPREASQLLIYEDIELKPAKFGLCL